MKLSLIVILLLAVCNSFAQSVSIKELEKFVKQPVSTSEQELIDKSFSLSESKSNGNNVIKNYTKDAETIYLGWIWTTKDGRSLREVTYMTTDKSMLTYILIEVKDAGFIYKSDSDDSSGKHISVQDDTYTIDINIAAKDGDYSGVEIVEK